MSRTPLVLGLDVGGTKLAAGVAEADGRLRSFVRAPSRRDEGPAAMIERLLELGRRALDEAGIDGPAGVEAIGVSVGGPLDPARGVVLAPPNLPGWHDVPLGDRIRAALGGHVAMDNDATAAALAEHRFGAGRGVADLVYFTISTGIGGGVISGGRPIRGASGNGAELGHLVVDPGGRPCPCGRRGCLEAFASGTNIAVRAREAASRAATLMTQLSGGIDGISPEVVLEAVRRGDAVARQVWDETAAAIGEGVLNAINAFEPSLVILGGGVATGAGELLLEPVRNAVPLALSPAARSTRVEIAALGDAVGVLGAAAIALEQLEAGSVGIGAIDATGAGPFGGRRSAAVALREHLEAAGALTALLPEVDRLGDELCEALGAGHRVVAFGNGGSAADAQHLAAELVGHYRRDRDALPAIALTANSSVVTAVANDYAWEDVFARQVEALVERGDVAIGISTSGDSENVVRGLRAAAGRGARTVALTGGFGGRIAAEADLALVMPAASTARIQELHGFVIHAVSEIVDAWAAARSSTGARGGG